MKRSLSFVLSLGVLCALFLPLSGASAQSDGPALCEAALAAANNDATRFQGTPIVYGSGGSGAQIVLGTDGPDVLTGGSGNDTLCGFGGDDELYGGSGNDILVGGAGFDALYGESGGDTLYASTGEIANGGTGNNRLITVTEGPDTRSASISFRFAEGEETCFADVLLSGFSPNTIITVDSFVSTNASGAEARYNNTIPISIGDDGTGGNTDFTLLQGIVPGEYYQVSSGSFASPWTLIDCAPFVP